MTDTPDASRYPVLQAHGMSFTWRGPIDRIVGGFMAALARRRWMARRHRLRRVERRVARVARELSRPER